VLYRRLGSKVIRLTVCLISLSGRVIARWRCRGGVRSRIGFDCKAGNLIRNSKFNLKIATNLELCREREREGRRMRAAEHDTSKDGAKFDFRTKRDKEKKESTWQTRTRSSESTGN
jgi:adenine-specific DNA methylase